jgi:hypothetical protein
MACDLAALGIFRWTLRKTYAEAVNTGSSGLYTDIEVVFPAKLDDSAERLDMLGIEK